MKQSYRTLYFNWPIKIKCPIRLLHGRLDQVVSFETSKKIINKIESENKQLKIIEDGDHSLSRDQDLKILFQTITELAL